MPIPANAAEQLRARLDTAEHYAARQQYESAYLLLSGTVRALVESDAARCLERAPGFDARCVRDAGHVGECTADGVHFHWTALRS